MGQFHLEKAASFRGKKACSAGILPRLGDFVATANTLWCLLVMLAAELMAWTQMLAFAGTQARRWEPKKLRTRIFEITGKISSHARQ
jgi:hypothetical protein